jgi:hypothetical protein
MNLGPDQAEMEVIKKLKKTRIEEIFSALICARMFDTIALRKVLLFMRSELPLPVTTSEAKFRQKGRNRSSMELIVQRDSKGKGFCYKFKWRTNRNHWLIIEGSDSKGFEVKVNKPGVEPRQRFSVDNFSRHVRAALNYKKLN